MRRITMAALVGLMLVGCGSDPKDPEPQGEGESGAVDYCERFGWYGDGHCDEICDLPDPDCSQPTNNVSPGRPVVPPPEPEPVCDDVFWGRDYVGYGDECLTIFFDCSDGWTYFDDECGCGCEEPQNPAPSCDYLWDQGEVQFVSEDPESCTEIRFACDDVEGATQFFDPECGCGCIIPWNIGPVACLDDSKPDVDRLGDVAECTLIDFFCAEGWTYFYDDCGCGCRVVCSDDFECPNGYCETGVDDLPMCVYPSCDDGSEAICAMVQPICYDTDVLSVVNGCWECLDARTCGPSNGP